MNTYKDDKTCEEHLTGKKFAQGKFCSHCGSISKIYTLNRKTKYEMYKCSDCKKKFSIITNTIFQKSNIGLQKWYLAIYLLNTSSKGISSVQLAKKLGIQQRTSWFMLHRLREISTQNSEVFKGTVEVDETFVGGKEKTLLAT